MEGLNIKEVLFSVCRSKINRERLVSFKSCEAGPRLSQFASPKDGLVPFVLPLLGISAAFPKTRSETNPSLSSAKHSCGFYSSGWRLLSRRSSVRQQTALEKQAAGPLRAPAWLSVKGRGKTLKSCFSLAQACGGTSTLPLAGVLQGDELRTSRGAHPRAGAGVLPGSQSQPRVCFQRFDGV